MPIISITIQVCICTYVHTVKRWVCMYVYMHVCVILLILESLIFLTFQFYQASNYSFDSSEACSTMIQLTPLAKCQEERAPSLSLSQPNKNARIIQKKKTINKDSQRNHCFSVLISTTAFQYASISCLTRCFHMPQNLTYHATPKIN